MCRLNKFRSTFLGTTFSRVAPRPPRAPLSWGVELSSLWRRPSDRCMMPLWLYAEPSRCVIGHNAACERVLETFSFIVELMYTVLSNEKMCNLSITERLDCGWRWCYRDGVVQIFEGLFQDHPRQAAAADRSLCKSTGGHSQTAVWQRWLWCN